MKSKITHHETMLKLAVCLAMVASFAGCGAPGGKGILPTTLSVNGAPGGIPVNTSVTFTAVATNATVGPAWTLSPLGFADVGTLSSQGGTVVTYTAPPVPPVYGPLGWPGSSEQGIVTLTVSASDFFFYGVTDQITFAITTPEITTGIAPETATMALGSSVEFYGYAVGNANNGITWQVNGVTNGADETGTIVNQGYYPADGGDYVWPGTYFAPATMPTSGNTVTIDVVSLWDETKSSSAVVTLQQPSATTP